MKRVVVWYSIMSLLLGVIGCGSGDDEPTRIIKTDPADKGQIFTNGNLTITFNNEVYDVEVNGVPAKVSGTIAIWYAQGLSIGNHKFMIQWSDVNGNTGSKEITLEVQPPKPDPTYINKKFLVKITNLPVETWTVKTLGTDEQGKMIYTEPGSSDYILLLMEPIPENQFIDLDKDNLTTNIINAGMPFIEVILIKMDGMDFPSYKLPEIVKSVFTGIDLNESKPVAGANCTGYQVTVQLDLDTKFSLSYFVKKDILVGIGYIAQNTEYDKYLDVYNNVVKNLTLMGM